MARETIAIRFPLDRETLWHERFPALHRRTHGFAIDYLCVKARRGCVARQLYGAAKEIFQLDDTTIRERILDVAREGYILVEPGGEPLGNRSFLRPPAALLRRHDTYLLHLAGRVVEIVRDCRSAHGRCRSVIGDPVSAVWDRPGDLGRTLGGPWADLGRTLGGGRC